VAHSGVYQRQQLLLPLGLNKLFRDVLDLKSLEFDVCSHQCILFDSNIGGDFTVGRKDRVREGGCVYFKEVDQAVFARRIEMRAEGLSHLVLFQKHFEEGFLESCYELLLVELVVC